MSAANFYINTGDTKPVFFATLKDATGVVNLGEAATVTLTFNDTDFTMEVVNASAGRVKYTWQDGDVPTTAGIYSAKIKVVWSDDNVSTFPNSTDDTLNIHVGGR